MAPERNIISSRYLNDGVPLLFLNDFQKKNLKLFLEDSRIKYQTIIECPICKEKNSILIAEKDRYAIPIETVVCERCGLIRNYKQFDEEGARIFYVEYYRNIYDVPGGETIEGRYKFEEKRRIPKYITKDKVVMEIGCGGGWNLMRFLSYKHYGFDFDEKFIELGKSKGLNLYVGGLEKAIEMGIKCDYLIIDQVLEHVVGNPANFLSKLKMVLNEGALVNIYVPSLDLLVWGYSDYDLLGTLQNAHNFLFDEFTLKTIGKMAGFKIINCCANNLILQNSETIAEVMPNFSGLARGKKNVKYLKLAEKYLSFRKKVGSDKILFKKFYFLRNPNGCLKRFAMDYSRKI